MANPWEADIAVTKELAARLICTQFTDLHGTLEPFGNGWDNTAFLLCRQWVFRFPRRKCAVDLLAGELRVLPTLAPLLPMPVPAPVFVGTATAEYPYPFFGYRLIAGTTADRARLDDAARCALAGPLADFLRVLHAIPLTVADGLGIPGDAFGRLDVDQCLPRARERLDGLIARGDATPAQVGVLGDIMDAARGCRPAAATCILHGDLYMRHLIVDAGGLRGIIDWGDCHRGDPAMDLGMVFAALPAQGQEIFAEHYGPIAADTRALARFRAVVVLGHLSAFAHDIGDADLVAELRYAVGVLADGKDPGHAPAISNR